MSIAAFRIFQDSLALIVSCSELSKVYISPLTEKDDVKEWLNRFRVNNLRKKKKKILIDPEWKKIKSQDNFQFGVMSEVSQNKLARLDEERKVTGQINRVQKTHGL